MFDVNDLNASTAILTSNISTQENVNQSTNNSNLPSVSVSASASASASASFFYLSLALATNNTNSMLLTDTVVNTTAVVMDYATQWLSTTIATTAANLTSLSNESNSLPPTTSSSLFATSSTTTESILNYATTATAIAAGIEFTSIYNVTNVSFISSYDATDIDTTTSTAATLYSLDDSDNFYPECHPKSPSFNCSRRDFVLFMMGPQRLPIHKLLERIYRTEPPTLSYSYGLVSIISAKPFYIYTYIKYLKYPPDQNQMPESGILNLIRPKIFLALQVSSLFSFLLPMFSMFYFYGRMGVQQGSVHRESRHQQSRKTVIRMLAAVVMTFFVCWLPFHFQRLWFVHGEPHKYYREVNDIINPILYNVMSHRYRVAFLDILCRKRRNVYYNNGLARDQSSFRETTVASSLHNNSTYNHRGPSIRDRSLRIVNNVKDRSSIKSNNISWKNSIYNTPAEKPTYGYYVLGTLDGYKRNSFNKFKWWCGVGGTNVVVVCGVNGRTKVFTENEVQVSLLKKNNETCI
ncbi:hypothetical protein DOY81_009465 [Sarcophaga bullata]|nr:hypothetical protein DOY81_009465 [Sarcophaga bullata]